MSSALVICWQKKVDFSRKLFTGIFSCNLTLGVHIYILEFSVNTLKNKHLPPSPKQKTFATLKMDQLETMNVNWALSDLPVIFLLAPGKTFVKSPLSFPKWVV